MKSQNAAARRPSRKLFAPVCRVVFILAVLLLASRCEAHAQLGQAQGKMARNLVYRTVNGKELKLDLYIPGQASEGPGLPVVVWIHGGAWREGSKDKCPAVALVNRGFAVASISYRFSNEATFPAQIEDCKAAIRWLRAKAKGLRLDPNRIGVWGASAGGHLAALLGTSGDVKELEGGPDNLDQSSRVQAVCDFFGPTDFLRMDDTPGDMDHDAADSPESALIGGPIQKNREKAARANPITYITADDPPFFILHGDQDRLVPISQSQMLYEALRRAGVPARFGVVKGEGHGFKASVNEQAFQFFERVLKR